MITENLSTLKIHKLTQAQYDRELEAGRLDESALYLTPDNGIDTTLTIEGVAADAKAVGDALAEKQPVGDYVLKSEIPTVSVQSVNGKTGVISLNADDVGARPNTWMPSASEVGADASGTANSLVSTHNSASDSHSDIREELSNKLNSSELTTAINNALDQAK